MENVNLFLHHVVEVIAIEKGYETSAVIIEDSYSGNKPPLFVNEVVSDMLNGDSDLTLAQTLNLVEACKDGKVERIKELILTSNLIRFIPDAN